MKRTIRKYLSGGDRNPTAKIEIDVGEAERRIAAGEKAKDLAAEYGMHPGTLNRKRRAYRMAQEGRNT